MTSSTQGWDWRVTNVLGMGFVQQMQLAAVDAAGKAQGGVWGHSAGSQLCPACVSLWIFVSDGHRHPCSHPEENGLHEIVSPIDFLGGSQCCAICSISQDTPPEQMMFLLAPAPLHLLF